MGSNFDLTTSEAAAKIEESFQRPLPEDYAHWLTAPDSAYPAPAEVPIPHESPWIHRIEMFYAAQQILQTLQEDAELVQEGALPSFPAQTIPIGESYGDYYLLSLRDRDYGSVLFLFHETADPENDFRDGFITLAESFSAWLPTLTSVADDDEGA